MRQQFLDVALKPRPLRRVFRNRVSGRLQPTGVMFVRHWVGLFAKRRRAVPAIVEHHEHGLDPLAIRDVKVPLYAPDKTVPVMVPQQVVQIDPHFAAGHYHLAEALFRLGKIDEARKAFEQGRYGRGRVVLTTFRLFNDSPGVDPIATSLLDGLIALALSED